MDKRQIQALILSFSGAKTPDIASEIGVSDRTIQAWKNKQEWKDLEAIMSEAIVIENATEISSKIGRLFHQSLDFLESVLLDRSEDVSIKNKLQASNQILSLLRYQNVLKDGRSEEVSSGLSDDTIGVIKSKILGICDD